MPTYKKKISRAKSGDFKYGVKHVSFQPLVRKCLADPWLKLDIRDRKRQTELPVKTWLIKQLAEHRG